MAPLFLLTSRSPRVASREWGHMKDLEELKQVVAEFARERNWDQFHSPKNLAMALSVEAAELLEQFQWLSEAESMAPPSDRRQAVADEIADVLVYLVRLADRLNIDIGEAVARKMLINAEKYPADKVRGSSRKYTEY